MERLRNIIYHVLRLTRILPFVNLVRITKLIALDFGYLNSAFKYQSVDKENKAVPWFSYPAIEYLNSLDLKEKTVFEYGTGNSTIYWASRTKRIIGIENNPGWFKYVKDKTQKAKNINLILKTNKSEYVDALSKLKEKFDIVVVDGEYREKCINHAIKHIKDGGFVILDNSDWYPNLCKTLNDKGFTEINFSGFGPINPYCTTTSLFTKTHLKIEHKSSHFRYKNHIGAIDP